MELDWRTEHDRELDRWAEREHERISLTVAGWNWDYAKQPKREWAGTTTSLPALGLSAAMQSLINRTDHWQNTQRHQHYPQQGYQQSPFAQLIDGAFGHRCQCCGRWWN